MMTMGTTLDGSRNSEDNKVSRIKEIEIEIAEIENEIGNLKADLAEEFDEDRISWYLAEIAMLGDEMIALKEELHHLEIEGEL